jgi:hypothetical protein
LFSAIRTLILALRYLYAARCAAGSEIAKAVPEAVAKAVAEAVGAELAVTGSSAPGRRNVFPSTT